MMNHLDLFSGIGGFSLALESTGGFKTVGFVERDNFCRKVLRKHWPDVPIYDDITAFSKGCLYEKIDIVTGGFPCQPFSTAGKQRGKEDDRYLWPEMLRVIKEFNPSWVIGENVAGIINMELERVCLDLEMEGYEVWPIVIPACAVNAPHRRDRVWIIAYSESKRPLRESRDFQQENGRQNGQVLREPISADKIWTVGYSKHNGQIATKERKSVGTGKNSDEGRAHEACESARPDSEHETVADTHIKHREESRGKYKLSEKSEASPLRWDIHGRVWDTDWVTVATRVCRVDDGIPRRVDRGKRISALGNSIVPQIVYHIGNYILEIENDTR